MFGSRRFRSLRGTAALAVTVALLATACSGGGGDGASESGTTESITVTDQRDKQVTLDGPVQRIVSAVIPAPTIIAAVDGSWDRIVGINSSLLAANKQGLIGKIFPASTSTAVVADRTFVPDMETILELDPDVVIQWGYRGEDILAPIEQSGIPVVGLEYGTQEDLETWVTLFGELIGKQDRATQIIDRMHSESADIQARVAALAATAPRGLQLSYSPEKLSVSNGKNYAQHVFDIAGVTNVAKDAETTDGVVNAEQIIAWDPEIIFLSAFDTATPADLYADARLADVSAVKNKRVYRSPLGVYRWQVPCAESPLYWNWVAALAYPEAYQVDLASKMRAEVSFLYGYDLTQADIELVLRTDINTVSASYDAVAP